LLLFFKKEGLSSFLSRCPVTIQTDSRLQQTALGVLALLLFAAGIYTLWNFLSALAWAAIFAIGLWPLYRRLRSRTQSAVLPAAFTLGVALVFIAPIFLVGLQLARDFHAISGWVQDAQAHGIPEPQAIRVVPVGRAQIDAWWQKNLADPGQAKQLLERATHGRVGGFSRTLGEQAARRLTLFGFTLLTLFFLFKEADTVTDQMRRAASRAFGAGGERIGVQMIASVHGTVNGLVLVGLGEGVILGIVYAIAGVPHPTIFGAVTAVAAMIPFAAAVAFGLAALILLAQGSVVWAIVVLGAGLVVTFTADHFVRPVLIGGATRLPFLWVLLGILGGVEAWGLVGLFLGPAIMAALILLWREFVAPDPLSQS
jgi:predicted PurR-regulated permease PerM